MKIDFVPLAPAYSAAVLRRTELVFAYGSNLCLTQIQKRCPSARAMTKASLPGFALAFAGHSVGWDGAIATIRKRSRAQVHGVVYAMLFLDLLRLDGFEGTPTVYERIRVAVRAPCAANTMPVHTYRLLRGADEPGIPSADYLATITRAYRAWDLPRAALARAAYAGA